MPMIVHVIVLAQELSWPAPGAGTSPEGLSMAIYFKQSNWMNVRRCAEADGVAVIPLGSLEQHGPHLPCGTDTFEVNEFVARAVAMHDDALPVCVCPTIEYSVVSWASPMASAGVSPFTLQRIILEVCHALTDLGFTKIALVYGHKVAGDAALWQAMYEKRSALYVDIDPYARCGEQLVEIAGVENHGSCMETSMMLAIAPELVDMDKAVDCPEELWPDHAPFDSISGRGVYPIPTVEDTPEGHCGTDPRRATAEIGNRLLDTLAKCLADVLEPLAGNPTPPQFKRVWRKEVPTEQ